MFRSDFERKADELRSQIESLRQNLDDVLSNYSRVLDAGTSQIESLRKNLDDVLASYNKLLGVGTDMVAQAQGPMKSAARTVRSNVESVRSNVGNVAESLPSPGGFNWWIPVGIVGAIGAAIWAFNTFFPRESQEFSNQFSQTAQQVGNQASQTARQMGDQVSQSADQLQSKFAQSNPAHDQFGGHEAGRPTNLGPGETTFGEQR